MSESPDETPDHVRELTPIQGFWDPGYDGIKDFSLNVVRVDPSEREEVDAVLETAPKAVPAQVSATSLEQQTVPQRSETPVPPSGETLKALDEAAALESGKLSELNEDVPPTPTTTAPAPETSSPSSSSDTSPGWSTPPAPVAPPTSG